MACRTRRGRVTTTWSKVSGPGTVTFGNPNAVDTTASFSAAGTYVLRLTANDSLLSSSDDITVTVNAAGGPQLSVIKKGAIHDPGGRELVLVRLHHGHQQSALCRLSSARPSGAARRPRRPAFRGLA